MWWQLIILPQRGGVGWQRLSAGGMNIATGPRWNKDRWVRTSNGPGCTSPFLLLSRQASAQKQEISPVNWMHSNNYCPVKKRQRRQRLWRTFRMCEETRLDSGACQSVCSGISWWWRSMLREEIPSLFFFLKKKEENLSSKHRTCRMLADVSSLWVIFPSRWQRLRELEKSVQRSHRKDGVDSKWGENSIYATFQRFYPLGNWTHLKKKPGGGGILK